jgi:hypothetical protein
MPTNDEQRLARLEGAVTKLVKMKEAEANAAAQKKGATERMHNQLSRALPPALRPLNVGEYSKVVWSYWFPCVSEIIAPNSAVDVLVQITQEAAFILTHMFASVFQFQADTPAPGQNTYTYLSDLNPHPLKLSLIDAQSSRQFMNAPEMLAMFGDNERPRQIVTPNFYLPNSTIVARIQNDSPTNYYKVSVNLLGARVRVDEAASVLGTLVD